MPNAPLTDKEKAIYKYLKKFIDKNGYSPTYRQIQEDMSYEYIGTVQTFLKQLSEKGYIQMSGRRRGLQLVDDESSEANRVPLVGSIAAGLPIEAVETMESIDVPRMMLKSGGQYFALKVKGDSMLNAHIVDGDIVIIRKQRVANNGETVAAIVDNCATLKKFYRKSGEIELHSENEKYKPIRVKENSNFEVLGVLTGVIRKV